MKIEYKFADGTKTEIEVDEKWGSVVKDMTREENNNDRKQRYHCYSMDRGNEDGFQYEDKSYSDDTYFKEPSREECLHVAMSKLNQNELKLITSVYFDGKTRTQLAKENGITKQVMSRKIKAIEKKLKKFL